MQDSVLHSCHATAVCPLCEYLLVFRCVISNLCDAYELKTAYTAV